MSPGNLNRLPDESFIFIDGGFLSKLSYYLGNAKYLTFDIIKLAENLCSNQGLTCKRIYYYTAPPFQSEKPTEKEEKKRKDYDRFVRKLIKNKKVIIREGRCQRLTIDGKFKYSQKAVDSLAIMDLMEVPLDNENIKKIILIACDSDFVPVVKRLQEKGIKIILYTYYQKSRDEKFSTSNHLIKSVDKYIILNKSDFDGAPLIK